MSRPKRPAPPDQRFQFDQIEVCEPGRAYRLARERMGPMIRGISTTLADGDLQLKNDLLQEADIALWELDASRFHADNERYFRRAVSVRMRLFMRAERRRKGGVLYVPPEEVEVEVELVEPSDDE